MSYGSAYTSGWFGVGICYSDEDYNVLWFDCVNHDEDISIYNELMQMNILEYLGELNTTCNNRAK